MAPDAARPLLVVAPTRRELGGLRSGKRRDIAAATVGIGRQAAPALAALIRRYAPARILSLGFAGGLSRELHTGDVLACERVIAPEQEPLPLPFPASMSGAAGTLLTADALLPLIPDKWQARSNTGADLVDLEGYHLAKAAREAGVPLCAVRVVLDEVDEELPPFVGAIVAAGGRREWLHAGIALVRNPLATKQMVALSSTSRRAGAALRKAVGELLDQADQPWTESS